MKATEQLMQEHEAILRMLDVLDAVCAQLQSGRTLEVDHLSRCVLFVREFADRCHHGKEEGILFPAMEQGPIGVMLNEHTLGRSFVRGMASAIDAITAGTEGASAQFVRSAQAYVTLLRAHIMKENRVLFPMADVRLASEKAGSLEKEFAKFDSEVIGSSKRAEWLDLLAGLEAQYLIKRTTAG